MAAAGNARVEAARLRVVGSTVPALPEEEHKSFAHQRVQCPACPTASPTTIRRDNLPLHFSTKHREYTFFKDPPPLSAEEKHVRPRALVQMVLATLFMRSAAAPPSFYLYYNPFLTFFHDRHAPPPSLRRRRSGRTRARIPRSGARPQLAGAGPGMRLEARPRTCTPAPLSRLLLLVAGAVARQPEERTGARPPSRPAARAQRAPRTVSPGLLLSPARGLPSTTAWRRSARPPLDAAVAAPLLPPW